MIKTRTEIPSTQVPPVRAALALQRDFARFALRLRTNDRSLQDDLIQEMSLGVLQCTQPHTLSFFRSRAISRARDFLKIWQRKSRALQDPRVDLTGIPAPGARDSERGADWYLEKIGALMEIRPGTARARLAPNPDS